MRSGIRFTAALAALVSLLVPSAAFAGEPAGTWEETGKAWRYRTEDGSWLTKSWLFDGGKWYYFDSFGEMVTDQTRIDGQYYFFHSDGSMASGWLLDYDRNDWYYADENGAFHTGWLSSGPDWYWFDARGRLYDGTRHMIDGKLYDFYPNGKLVSDNYKELRYYNADGVHMAERDITVYGERRPYDREKEQITEVCSEIPSSYIRLFHQKGWELMFYTDKAYFSAPATDQGIDYVRYKLDKNYKKLKFTDPAALRLGFGEFIALMMTEETDVLADYYRYLDGSELAAPHSSWYEEDPDRQFAAMFDDYCTPAIRADWRRTDPAGVEKLERLLGTYSLIRKPDEGEMNDDGTMMALDTEGMEIRGPAGDEELLHKKSSGPAAASEGGS
ncbi:MAG: N-acetylmuramoyl-L-alanine amidase family protein [Clostridium sp.]|nr:N-acetylmuramoyl-L-alanine amidase family protein [Clostridium sp.]